MAKFAELALLAGQLAGEASRLSKRAAIVDALTRIARAKPGADAGSRGPSLPVEEALVDAGLFCLYLAGQPFPEADPRKLNAGGALLSRTLKEISGCTAAAPRSPWRR